MLGSPPYEIAASKKGVSDHAPASGSPLKNRSRPGGANLWHNTRGTVARLNPIGSNTTKAGSTPAFSLYAHRSGWIDLVRVTLTYHVESAFSKRPRSTVPILKD